MTNEQKVVLRKIIYAAETGGQVYGQQDYSDFWNKFRPQTGNVLIFPEYHSLLIP